jgi:RND family efflux transporter MFP subunit
MYAPTSSSPSSREEGSKAVHAPAPPPVSRVSRVVAILVAILAVVGLGAGIANRLSAESQRSAAREATLAEQQERANAPVDVEVAVPVAFQYDPHFSITGTLDPIQEADVAFNAGGRLLSIGVTLGQHVDAGDVLATLDRRSVTAQTQLASAAVQASEAQLTLAQDRLRRAEALHSNGATSDADLLAAQQQFALAQAQLSQASAQGRLATTDGANHILRAPFAGTVTRVPEGVGNVVAPGQALFRVEDLSSLVLRSGITERALDRVQVGDAVELESPPVRGEVRAFARSLDPVTRRAPIEIALDNREGRLVGHSLAKGSILTGRTFPALRIPATAIRSDGTVLVVSDDATIEVRPVESIVDGDGSGVVLGGLEASDRVVVRPSPDLTPGRRVSSNTPAEPEAR